MKTILSVIFLLLFSGDAHHALVEVRKGFTDIQEGFHSLPPRGPLEPIDVNAFEAARGKGSKHASEASSHIEAQEAQARVKKNAGSDLSDSESSSEGVDPETGLATEAANRKVALQTGGRYGAVKATDYARFVSGANLNRTDLLAAGEDFFFEMEGSREDGRLLHTLCRDDALMLSLYKKERMLRSSTELLLGILRGLCKEIPFRCTYVRRYLPHIGSGADEANALHSEILDEFGLGDDHVENLEKLHEECLRRTTYTAADNNR